MPIWLACALRAAAGGQSMVAARPPGSRADCQPLPDLTRPIHLSDLTTIHFTVSPMIKTILLSDKNDKRGLLGTRGAGSTP